MGRKELAGSPGIGVHGAGQRNERHALYPLKIMAMYIDLLARVI